MFKLYEGNVSISIENILPTEAKHILENYNPHNRKVTKNAVKKYATYIRNGEWLFTHQGIAFDVDGNLIDGQHRLQATVDTGIPLKAIVVRGLDVHVRGRVDQGKNRQVLDVLLYHYDRDITKTQLSALRTMLIAGGRFVLEASYIDEHYDEYFPHVIFAEKYLSSGIKKSGLLVGLVAKAHQQGFNPSRLTTFCGIMNTGIVTSPEDAAAVKARDYFLHGPGLDGKNREETFKYLAYMLLKFLEYKDVVKYRKENDSLIKLGYEVR